MTGYDLVVCGAGTAGIPCAAIAARRGLKVLLVEAAGRIGGTLHYAGAHMSAGGTRMQARRGIEDSPEHHFADAVRISRGTLDAPLARRAIDLAPGTIDWLEEIGLAFPADMPRIVHNHEPYSVARTLWPEGGGPALLCALAPLLEAEIARGGVTLALGTRLAGLARAGDAVDGVRLRDAAGEREVRAAHVVLATGGYGGNPALFETLHGKPLHSGCWEANDGGGMLAAQAIGGVIERAETFLPSFGGTFDHTLSPPRHVALGNLVPQARPPWEIWVDAAGARFIAEDEASVDARERALLRLPGLRFWVMWDAAVERAAPPLFPGWPPEKLARCRAENPTFREAPTLDALADACGMEAETLAATVRAYNAAVAAGRDALGRRFMPLPLVEPPFRAVAQFGIALKTYAGLAVDEALRVRRDGGGVFANLRAAGEVLGGGRLSGNAFVGGMSVTPALAFGRWLGETVG